MAAAAERELIAGIGNALDQFRLAVIYRRPGCDGKSVGNFPRDRWIAFSHELILHGRSICVARKPRCAECPLETACWAPDKTWRSH